ncbi:translocon-associated protein subunit alpha [Lingula anatina]|uniref:Translocon-associated protein subunit alpha n=1 Tax=Lingula anatina TaxID=7574 RepID=A0A1S3HSV9_LINAN|nr:translocon-associated protein subunit alpha [Lingula anatina]|eukprot:XP_013389108.1 translocon-associated protein subunit alpha [Lingula anatina]
MTKFLGKFLLLLLLILPSTFMLAGNGVVSAAEDPIEDVVDGEEEDGTVEEEGAEDTGSEAAQTDKGDEEEEEEEEATLKPSPDADTSLLFTKPAGATTEFFGGSLVRLLVGFANSGEKDFIVESMDASFRYPQDYSFYIQNFTAARYNRLVEPKAQATFEYAFFPSEQFNGRPFGLSINLNYRDVEGNYFQDAVFNETVQIVESDEGLDGETFFLYVVLAALAVLLLVGAQQLVATFGKKRLGKPKSAVEMGTQNNADVDFDWIPKETLEALNKSPRKSPKQSPRQSPRERRTKRASGAGDE